MSEIPDITIRPINIPDIQSGIYIHPSLNAPDVPVAVPIGFPIIEMPCVQARRASYENEALISNDPDGNVVLCEGNVPSFTPIDFTPEDIIPIDNSVAKQKEEEELPPPITPDIPVSKEENKDNFFVDCPGPKDQRIGDFRNEKRLERVKGHERSEDGRECITLYEPVTFVETYLPSGATASFTAATALVAASTPLLLNVIKPVVKNLFKKLTTRKKKKDDAKVENEIA